jgi:D-3-phosphoglycerate dehydrogenase
MNVYGYDPYISVNAAWHMSKWVQEAKNIETILKECDYISLHAPSTKETKGMINADTIALMKDGAKLLNFARGDLVNTQDLLDAVASGKISKYITDFACKEIINKDNIIVMPHLGASTPESEDNCAKMAVKQLKDYLETGNITNSVNFPAVNEPRCAKYRICIIHKNVPTMLAKFATLFADANINIENMINKAKGNFAYTIIETNDLVDETKLTEVENVIKVRILK